MRMKCELHIYNNFVMSSAVDLELQTFCDELFKNLIFLGNYKEKVLVNSINDYRDLIVVNKAETVLIGNLDKFILEIKKNYNTQQTWIGVTSPNNISTLASPSYSILTRLKYQPFGLYWFQIKKIKFTFNEVFFKVKCIRPLESADHFDNNRLTEFKTISELFSHYFKSWKTLFQEFLNWFVLEGCATSLVKCILLLLISAISSAFYVVKNIGSFTIQFMHQLNNIIKVSTPIILGIFDLFSKIIGGFYILLAMMWRDTVGTRNRVFDSIERGRNGRAIHNFQHN